MFQVGKWTTSADCVFSYPILSTTAYKSNISVVQRVWYKIQTEVGLIIRTIKLIQIILIWFNAEMILFISKMVFRILFTNLFKYQNKWYYVVKGKVDKSYTGLVLFTMELGIILSRVFLTGIIQDFACMEEPGIM